MAVTVPAPHPRHLLIYVAAAAAAVALVISVLVGMAIADSDSSPVTDSTPAAVHESTFTRFSEGSPDAIEHRPSTIPSATARPTRPRSGTDRPPGQAGRLVRPAARSRPVEVQAGPGPADGTSVLVRVDDRLSNDRPFERLEAGLPPLWSPAQSFRGWWRASPVLEATPPGANKQPICELTIDDSVWAWPQ